MNIAGAEIIHDRASVEIAARANTTDYRVGIAAAITQACSIEHIANASDQVRAWY